MSISGGSGSGGRDRSSDEFDGPTAAFRRLLKDVANDERARVDALVVLSQRTIYVATWPTDPDSGIRTLTSSGGDTAMPLFSSLDVLKDAAQRFGWLNPDGSLSFRELGARDALRRAVARGVQFVVIDIGSEHSVEFARGEIEPLISSAVRKDSTGPFAVSSKVSTALMDAVRRTSRPPPMDMASAIPAAGSLKPAAVPRTASSPSPSSTSVSSTSVSSASVSTASVAKDGAFPPERHASVPPRASSGASAPPPSTRSSAAPSNTNRKRSVTPDAARLTGPLVEPTGMTFAAPHPMPSDDCLDQVSDALRRFPEVEWAAVTTATKDGASQTMIVLRVDAAYRTRLPDLNRRVRLAAEDAGTPMGVAVIDDVAQVKSARSVGVVFFPWKKKAKTS